MSELPVVGAFHFLRPLWLLGLLALPALLWWLHRTRHDGDVWRGVVDAHLLSHLLENAGTAKRGWRRWLSTITFALAAVLAVLALAGPSWREVPQPLWQDRMPLVVAVDLSSATSATDVPPSRLLQARAKIAEILRRRGGGQFALVAFASDAYTVSPLTDDAANVALFLDALAPDVMPRDGSHADRAIEESARLLRRAGFHHGDILLITDHAGSGADGAAIEARASGYRVSVLGMGSEAGGPYRDRRGEAHVARLQDTTLRAVTVAGGGRYAAFAPGDADLQALGVLAADRIDQAAAGDKRAETALDEGFWLLPPLLLLGLLAFRRGVLAVLVIALWLPWRPAAAADLWQRDDQRAQASMAAGVDAYRRGDFAAAETAWRGLPGAEAAYNRGNAYARQGRYDEAIAEYDRALRSQPGMTDAVVNRRKVEEARRRQQNPQQDQQRQDQQRQDQQKQDQQKQDQQKQDQQRQDQQRQDQQKQDQQKQDQQRQDQQRQDQQRQDQQKQDQQKQDQQKQDQQRQDQQRQDQQRQDQQRQDQQRQDQQKPGQQRPGQSPDDAKPADVADQQAADRAQRERMARARADGTRPQGTPPPKETAEARERRLANEAWLRRVPDDPGGLLRAKFLLEQKRRKREGDR